MYIRAKYSAHVRRPQFVLRITAITSGVDLDQVRPDGGGVVVSWDMSGRLPLDDARIRFARCLIPESVTLLTQGIRDSTISVHSGV